MAVVTQVGITNGVPDSGTGEVATINALMADGGQATLGTKADAKSTATDTTAVSAMSVFKQISASVQAIATSVAGSLTVATHAVTQSGSWVLAAGSAIIGKVGIDQTTDGTTNKVAADLRVAGAAVATDAGASGPTVPRVTIANDSPGIIATGSQASPSAGYLSSVVAGDIAHDAADSGNPAKIGARATTSLSALTLVADGDRTNVHAGLDGVLITRPHCNLEAIVTGNATNTDGTSTSCIAASGVGIKTYLTSVILANTSSTAITVDVKDGATTKVSLPLPAGSGCIFNPPVPIPGTVNTAWNFDPSAAATTVTCSMVGFKSKV